MNSANHRQRSLACLTERALAQRSELAALARQIEALRHQPAAARYDAALAGLRLKRAVGNL